MSASRQSTRVTTSLGLIAARLRRKMLMLSKMSEQLVDLDIAARKLDRDIALDWVSHREIIQHELSAAGMTEVAWCKQELRCSIQTMRRRVQLLRGWDHYITRRLEVGDNGQFGLLYAAYLAKPDVSDSPTVARNPSALCDVALGSDP